MLVTPTAACIYTRLSYAPDGSLEKCDRQEGDCRDLADRIKWPVCCVYTDNSRSAWQRNRKRKDWDTMLTTLEPDAPHRHDGIIVYHGDRLIRQPWDLELLLKLADDRALPLASPQGTRDLSNEDDRFILRVEAAQACRASADTSRRVKRGWKARAEAGMSIGGGKRPFGFGVETVRMGRTGKPIYDTDVQRPEEARVLAEVVSRIFAGLSMGSSLRWMNTQATTTEGNPFTLRSLKHLLRSPRIAGLVAYGGELYQARWTPIIDPEDWHALQLLLDEKAEESGGFWGRERKYLLSGIAECYSCEGTVRVKPAGGKNRKDARLYYCPDLECEHRMARNVTHLDEYVTGRVLRRLNDKRFIAAVHADDAQPGVAAEIEVLQRRKEETQRQLEQLADHPDIDITVALRGLASFDDRISSLRQHMAETTRQRLLLKMAGITREQWDAEPVDVRAATVRELYRIIIQPATWHGPGFDPKSVKLEVLPLRQAA